ncbi:enoyl-CoA hydratase [Pseudofrankia inefficax]|uniref:Enoyl-CoA hydratase/isomerase n=1 Tax=Pseudofrankia inefficax (strain DSM 45817 / CECT 9037 / DDB 130130 / EuI1c) TaxID=298654 RepID=E3IVA6_PSEI1|nr:enoyl-CoA hydratase [Pseudofrankia inefficax]ADP81270.1 Enoyl-CoA hydratase/isomerase [Pseudofrankia inefficax]
MSEIEVSTDGGIRTIQLNRPKARNALSSDMQAGLVAALAAADQDPTVRVVVLTGTDPAFCAGNDFTDLGQFADRYANQFRTDPGRALRAMRTPVICAVNGACVSGGLEIALSASFIVASDRARFADTHARLDVIATWGLSALLPRAVGVRLAREMSITGRFLDATEALARGLVNHVVPHEDLLPFTARLAASVADTSAVRDVLALYARGEDLPLSGALSHETATAFSRPLSPTAFAARGRDIVKDPT